MTIAWEIVIPVLLGVAIMLKWAYAYYIYPKKLEKAIDGCYLGPFETHVQRIINSATLCAHAHVLTAFRDILLLIWVALPPSETKLKSLIVVLFFITLIPLWYGANYSSEASDLMDKDAQAINGLIGSTNELHKLNISTLGRNSRVGD